MWSRSGNANPGCLNHSRWLTTANIILLLYASDKKPSENLKTLVTYTIRVCALYTSALSTGTSLTQSFTATRTSLIGESALSHGHGPSTTHTRAGPATGDEGQSCTSHWKNTEVKGSRRTQLRRRGIFRHDRLGSLPYL